MPTRNINLTNRYDGLLSRLIESGRYKNASEVVRAGLRLLERQEREDEARIEALRRDARIGEDAYRQGAFATVEDDAALDRLFDDIAEEADKA